MPERVNETSAPEPPSTGPAGAGRYVVRQGECIYSIAFREGFDPEFLWNHAGNSQLRARRSRPELLLPGDRLHLPERSERPSFAISPGGTHSFRAQVPQYETTIELRLRDEPRKNLRCTLSIDGVTSEVTSDDSGKLTIKARPNARFARLVLHDVVDGVHFDEELEVELGGLDPLEELSGVQARLRNLGYHPGPVDGILGPRTRQAIGRFQQACQLSVTEELDEATRSQLGSRHGV